MIRTAFFVLFLALNIAPAQSQVDAEGASDHPLLTRYPGSFIASYEVIKFREYQLATGPITAYRHIEEKQTVAGQWYRITYQFAAEPTEVSLTEFFRDYAAALKKAEVQILAEGLFPDRNVKSQVGGGSWIGVALKPNSFPQKSAANLLFKGTSSSGGTFALIGQINRAEGPTYLAMYGERHSDKTLICHVDIIETKAAETGKVAINIDYLSQALAEKGHVSIYDINFDFDSATIRPDSKPALAIIAELLERQTKLQLYIVGHTDMKGTPEYNQQLSQRRAEAVRAALIKDHGISATRLQARGVGLLVPRASNRDEAGRALNRRVELVENIEEK